MTLKKNLLIMCALGAATGSQAQVPIGPFVSPNRETFEAIAPGAAMSFIGFGGMAQFQRIGAGGWLFVNNNPAVLPPFGGAQDMFGQNSDVRIRFAAVWTNFGGMFRVPMAGVPVGTVTMRFYNGGVPVTAPLTSAIGPGAWLWRGYNVAPAGGFDEVRLWGNGPLQGYVGMDNLVVN